MALKSVNIRIDAELLASSDEAASTQGMDRSNFIRSACVAALPGSSRDSQLADEVKVVDERARSIVKDLMERVSKLEQAVF